jgi:myo-inositol-1(or 4)-monophosphatase
VRHFTCNGAFHSATAFVDNGCLDVAIDVARESGALLAGRFTAGVQVDAKGRFDIVTEADHDAERVILQRLSSEYPSHAVVAEEGGRRSGTSSTHCWYVDPLDGTKNFARGYPAFAVSIAMECDGELVVGVVFDPIRGELFAAERGAGAFCNDRRIRVSAARRLDHCVIATGFPSASRHVCPDMRVLEHLAMTTQGLRRSGSSALDLAYVASARIDAFWDIGLKPWDVAAGRLLVIEAGGCCTDFRGGQLRSDGTELLADNGVVHNVLVQAFADGLVLPTR